MPTDRLRPEAQPTVLTRLDVDQRTGFDRVTGLLRAAVHSVSRRSASGERPRSPYVEPNRSSRTILIDGRRGTGKTTLLLTLFDVLVDNERTVDGQAGWPPDVAELRKQIVWLESLDMEPLDPSTNLLGALLARLEDAVGHELLGPAASSAGPPDLLTPGSGHHGNLGRNLVDLQTRAVSAFDGNLRDRAAELDPDSFAAASRRAERMRLTLSAEFAAVVHDLAASVATARRLDRNPVFVLPVDDLDLNPTSCVPLLEMVRAVQSPHLIVLVLADLRFVETAVRLKYERQFVEAGGRRTLPDGCADQAADLTANALRKHLPPEQQIHLAPVDPRRALEITPLDDDGESLLARFRCLQLAIDHVTVPGADAPPAAAPDRVLNDAVHDLPQSPTLRHASWGEFFRLPLREIVDMQIEANRRSDEPGDVLLDLAERRLGPCFGALDVEPEGVSVEAQLRWTRSAGRAGPQIETATILAWAPLHRLERVDPRHLPELVGALDLRVVHERHAERYQVLPTSLRRTVGPGHAPGQPVDWPMPQHSTTWGTERAADRLAVTDTLWSSPDTDDPDRLFGSWIQTMTAILREALIPSAVADTSSPAPNWDGVRAQLDALGDGSAANRWRAEVLALCTPEMGMTDDRATETWEPRRSGGTRRQAVAIRDGRMLPAELQTVKDAWKPPPVASKS